jgi:SAM-dependent methyltransferase
MSTVFGPFYAEAYDLLYQDKDYSAECDLIERLFRQYGATPIKRVLDLGCGTGNHAIPLAERGYHLTGVDLSAEMLSRARAKADQSTAKKRLQFLEGDIRQIGAVGQYEAVLILFAVLGYQLENADVAAALATARRHLAPGGLLLFDVWYGPAVLHQKPTMRMKKIETPDGNIWRATNGELNINKHSCQVRYRLWLINNNHLVQESEEDHAMRYFFPMELAQFMDHAGFSLTRLGAFPEFDRDPDESTWNALGVARAV